MSSAFSQLGFPGVFRWDTVVWRDRWSNEAPLVFGVCRLRHSRVAERSRGHLQCVARRARVYFSVFSRFVYTVADAMASSAPDPSLIDSTNVCSSDLRTLPIGLPTPPSERKRVSQLDLKGPERKRVKLEWPLEGKENTGVDVYSDSDSEGEGDASGTRGRAARYSVYNVRNRAMQAGPSYASRRVDRECYLCLC